MSKVDKIIEKMKRTKYGHTFEDCQKVLEFKGYIMKPAKGDHFKFSIKNEPMIVIARHRPVDPKAIEDVIRVWEK